MNELIVNSTITPETWERYSLYSNTNNAISAESQFEDIESENRVAYEPSMHVIETIITKLKTRKSTGPDKITNEILKYGGPTLISEIYKLFKKICETLVAPLQ